MTPLVSIIVPHYPRNDCFLEECFSSIISQTFNLFELLIVDNGEEPSKLAQKLSRSDPRCRYFYVKGAGICGARNYGLTESLGSFICFVDDDDCLDKNYLSDLYEAITSGDYNVAICLSGRILPSGRKQNYPGDPVKPSFRTIVYSDEDLLTKIPICPWAKMIKASYAKQFQFDTAHPFIAEDFLWCFQVFQETRTVVSTEKHQYWWRESSFSTSNTPIDSDSLPIWLNSLEYQHSERVRYFINKNSEKKVISHALELYIHSIIGGVFYTISRRGRYCPVIRKARSFLWGKWRYLAFLERIKCAMALLFPRLAATRFRQLATRAN